jgi:hypothetical protein
MASASAAGRAAEPGARRCEPARAPAPSPRPRAPGLAAPPRRRPAAPAASRRALLLAAAGAGAPAGAPAPPPPRAPAAAPAPRAALLRALRAAAAAQQFEVSPATRTGARVPDLAAPDAGSGPAAFVSAPGRIVAIGDLHGDLQKALACLELAGVLAEADGAVAWAGGDTTVVQLGDVLDRGDSEIATVLLLRELDRQARRAGGAVHMLNGNHESLNVAGDFRYVTPGAFWESAAAAGLPDATIARDRDAVLRARWGLYRPGGQMARELAKNPTVLVVNGEIAFAHGGLLPHHVAYGLQRLNDEVAAWMSGAHCRDGSAPAPPFPAMGDASSVMWNRSLGKERVSPYDRAALNAQLDATLGALGAAALVVGHTPQVAGLNAECGGRVWRVDAGMSSGVLGAEPQVLEFTRDSAGRLVARALCASGASAPELVYEPRAGAGRGAGAAAARAA